jgi:hypothetical protein
MESSSLAGGITQAMELLRGPPGGDQPRPAGSPSGGGASPGGGPILPAGVSPWTRP